MYHVKDTLQFNLGKVNMQLWPLCIYLTNITSQNAMKLTVSQINGIKCYLFTIIIYNPVYIILCVFYLFYDLLSSP
jgi:hypothetical protein